MGISKTFFPDFLPFLHTVCGTCFRPVVRNSRGSIKQGSQVLQVDGFNSIEDDLYIQTERGCETYEANLYLHCITYKTREK